MSNLQGCGPDHPQAISDHRDSLNGVAYEMSSASSSQVLIYLGPGGDSASVLGRILCWMETSTLAAGQKARPPSVFCPVRKILIVGGLTHTALDSPELSPLTGPHLEFWWALGINLSAPRSLSVFCILPFLFSHGSHQNSLTQLVPPSKTLEYRLLQET